MVRILRRGRSFEKQEQGVGSGGGCSGEMLDIGGNQAQNLVYQTVHSSPENAMFHNQGGRAENPQNRQQIGFALDRAAGGGPRSRLSRDGGGGSSRDGPSADVELMKEKFAKLLLGEDMSGGGKGVPSALALSNAITNLAASVFGEQRRLEPMPPETKARWRKEIDWLLSVADHIVELVPSQQKAKDGSNMEIMVTEQRKDLQMNIPALRKLDAMLLSYLDNFKDQMEFSYVSKDADKSEKGAARGDDKWWLPTVKVPPGGLSEVSRKWLQFQKDSVHQLLKAAMAINSQVLMEMEVPEAYIVSLPKNGRASLGDAIYRSITDEHFDPNEFLASMDLSTEHKILDLKNRMEASSVIWKRKMHNKDGKSSWGSALRLEKKEQFEERAEIILILIKQRFPGIPQSGLDISKIQYNKDVGQSILESYSRVLETLAFTVMSRIEDVIRADSLSRDPSRKEPNRRLSMSDSDAATAKKLDSKEAPTSTTLSDHMGWHFGLEADNNKQNFCSLQDVKLTKPPPDSTPKKLSYIEKLENLGASRSPTARH